ncbi:hypothetical protein GFD17_04360 [Bifidobacterium sp. SMB2]|uniref:ADP ribosyltransferase domain-containing protein n=1 Tax=Bifidobacterium saimiriisciurei TaxID=2661627 RepID=A0ABX0CDY3_9BIFI|nr:MULTISPECIES: ADP-ribosyltransferase [Bifidobacterium]NEG96004.1 hypothetical protein [Bifidobacterium sp. SMB2]NEH12469.1 hypothetical protein [Bifidobacterium saimiriisciurei]
MDSRSLPPISDERRRQLAETLGRLTKGYQDDLENLAEEAADLVESEHGRAGADLTDIMRDYARDASQRANDYYNAVRQAYEDAYGAAMEDFDTGGIYDPDRTLYRMAGGFNGTDYNGLNYEQTINRQSRAGMTIDDLWPSLKDVDDAMQWAADMVRASARYTMERNLADDPTSPRWARVTGGAKPCAFCVMLAGRGFVYHSEETAKLGGSFHDGHCHCTAIPGWKDDVLTPSQRESKAMYEASKAAAGEDAPRNAELAAMRRIYPDKLSDGVTPTPNIRWSHDAIKPTAGELARLSDFTVHMPWDQYTPQQKQKALRGWTDGTFKESNRALFGQIEMTETIRKRIDTIDEVLSDHSTYKQFTVDRYMRLDVFDISAVSQLPTIPLGKIVRHNGYMATSLIEGGVKVEMDGERIATRVLLPPGTNAVYLEPITKKKGQQEILLPRGCYLQYEGFGRQENGKPIIYARLV